ncbi:hypothetical protein Nepgr_018634 [Nepenthes gracilis]|uniref:Uncharacterized protein n=1 Tax=Nepenthes gracilis TaxID=150966 RepID=A0AAD3SSK9_NEPGR|nr:hypothetical protein Nepgr_018634 [Nepenthes gracilis]
MELPVYSAIVDMEGLMGNNRREDVNWLCSLSEAELEMLISLKKLALHRARVIGHEGLAKKFDLKMLRAFGFILMQHAKEKLKDLSIPGLSDSAALLDRCNLLKSDLKGTVIGSTTDEDAKTQISADTRKRKRAISESGGHFLDPLFFHSTAILSKLPFAPFSIGSLEVASSFSLAQSFHCNPFQFRFGSCAYFSDEVFLSKLPSAVFLFFCQRNFHSRLGVREQDASYASFSFPFRA